MIPNAEDPKAGLHSTVNEIDHNTVAGHSNPQIPTLRLPDKKEFPEADYSTNPLLAPRNRISVAPGFEGGGLRNLARPVAAEKVGDVSGTSARPQGHNFKSLQSVPSYKHPAATAIPAHTSLSVSPDKLSLGNGGGGLKGDPLVANKEVAARRGLSQS